MKFINRFPIFILLVIKIVFSEIYELQKIPSKIKSLRVKRRTLDYEKEDSFLEEVYGDSFILLLCNSIFRP
jgi:hypothetical protein